MKMAKASRSEMDRWRRSEGNLELALQGHSGPVETRTATAEDLVRLQGLRAAKRARRAVHSPFRVGR